MGLFRKKHDITDIYGVKSKSDDPFVRRGEVEAPETGRRHSDYYHKYFRGYTEIRKLNEKGRVKIERYYTRPWIVSGLSTGRYWLLRLLYAVLAAMSATAFITALSQRVPANFSWIVALPGYISIILLFLMVVVTLIYIFVAKKMTLWEHSSSTKRLKVFSLATCIGQALTGVTTAVYALATGVFVGESLLCAVGSLLAAVCAGVIFLVERKVPYAEIPNETKLPAGEAHEIW